MRGLSRILGTQRVLILSVIWLGSIHASAAETTLRYKFKVGDEIPYILTLKTTSEIKSPQLPMPITQEMTQTMHFKNCVDEVMSDGSARLRQTFTQIKLSSRSTAPGAQSFEYDSASDTEPTGPMAESVLKTIKPLLRSDIQQTMNPLGEITKVVLPQSMLDALKNNPALAAQGNTLSEEGMKNLTSQAGISFPEKPLEVGDSWSQSSDLKLPFGKLTTTRTMQYAGRNEQGLEKIIIQTKLTMEPAPNAPVSMKITQGGGQGELLFDPLRGRVHTSQLKQTMEAEITVAGQTLQQKNETTVNLKQDESTASP